jgi:predicted nucleic acid-binding protein
VILADTSIWVDHLRDGDATMTAHLNAGLILMHPFVVGELAMGNLPDRAGLLATLRRLPTVLKARDVEVLDLIEREKLFGRGLGFVDTHLLASALLTEDATLWSRDRLLHAAADRLGIAATVGARTRH